MKKVANVLLPLSSRAGRERRFACTIACECALRFEDRD